jgi:hypothetical protein
MAFRSLKYIYAVRKKKLEANQCGSESETLLFSFQICGFADLDTKEICAFSICRLIITNLRICDLWTGTSKNFLKLFFVVVRVSWPPFCFRRPYYIFKTGLDSNPESCHSKQARNLQMRNEPKNLRICDLPANKKN